MSDMQFEMAAKTFQGLEGVLAQELTALGATDVQQGRRVVTFMGDKELMYRANFCCRTALRILKPIYKFRSSDADDLYEQVKRFDWDNVLNPSMTFSIDTTAYSPNFRHSKFVTYRVKDAIADFFTEREGKRPSIRLILPDIRLDVHINDDEVTISLDSTGDPLYKRGWRVQQTEAPINEVLAAGIIMLSGWNGQCDLIDPMCGSGTFLIEAALIAANINPGVYRKEYAFQLWKDYDEEMFENIYNDDSGERDFNFKIYGSDIDAKAVAATRANIKSAGVGKMIEVEMKPIQEIEQAPQGGMLITNPPYGERLRGEDIENLYDCLGQKLKQVYKGYDAWVISSNKELLDKIGLRPSVKYELFNAELECELRQYKIFEGTYNEMRSRGEHIKNEDFRNKESKRDGVRREFKPTFERGDRPRRDRDGERRFERHGEERSNDRDFERSGEDRLPRKPRYEVQTFGDVPERKRFENQDESAPRRERRSWDDKERREHRERRFINREPSLGKENERPIIHGRRKSWKRRDIEDK
ncbi:MAG: RNA methyltransferase [Muribaculaceae bacterium]|nr:RNA methyltransferase [Muribaculaceae bacterium]